MEMLFIVKKQFKGSNEMPLFALFKRTLFASAKVILVFIIHNNLSPLYLKNEINPFFCMYCDLDNLFNRLLFFVIVYTIKSIINYFIGYSDWLSIKNNLSANYFIVVDD